MPRSGSRPPVSVRPVVAVLIPARNEAEALPGLFVRLDAESVPGLRDIIVVDNGSTDETATVAAAAGARVVTEPRPGYGIACQRGIDALAGDAVMPDVLVFLDADDYEAPAQIARLVEPILEDLADMVVGLRRTGKDPGVRWHAALGNRVILGALRVLYGDRTTDMGPFRAVRWSNLEALALDDASYGWYVQMQIRALRSGCRVSAIPVRFRRRNVGRSKVSGSLRGSLGAGWVMLRTLAVEVLMRSPPYVDSRSDV